MKKLLLALFLLMGTASFAQTLNPGDIVFTSIQTKGLDRFSFVSMVNIPVGTIIKFTDNAWNQSNAFRTGEDTMVYTTPAITKGEVVTIQNYSGKAVANKGGSITGSLSGLSQVGENLFAFQGAMSNPTFIALIATQPFITTGSPSANNTYLPSSLTASINAMSFTAQKSNGFYNIDTTSGTVVQAQAKVTTYSNWTSNDDSTLAGSTKWPNWVFFPSTVSTIDFSYANNSIIEQLGTKSIDINFSAPTIKSDTIKIKTSNAVGSAVYGTDYSTNPVPVSDTIEMIFPLGTSSATIDFTPNDDTIINGKRVIKYEIISATSGLVLGTTTTTLVEIVDNDTVAIPLPNTVNFANSTYGFWENISSNSVNINFSKPTTGSDTLVILSTNQIGNSVYGNDYNTTPISVNDTLTMIVVAGSTSASFNFSPINNTVVSPNRTIRYSLLSATSGIVIGSINSSDVSILDDDTTLNKVNFANTALSFYENSGVNPVYLTLTNPTTSLDTVWLTATAVTGTPTYGVDYSTNPVSINDTLMIALPVGSSNMSFSFNPIDNAVVSPARRVRYNIIAVSSNLNLGNGTVCRISILDDDTTAASANIPNYNINQVTTSDITGVADSLNVYCRLTGTVSSINFSTNGLQFAIYDATGAITVFKSTNVTPSYTVTEGDLIRVMGKVSQFNGLTEFSADSLVVISSANPVALPMTVSSLIESQESQLIQLNGLRMVNTAWPATGSNMNVTLTNGVDTFNMFIDKETNIDGTTAPNTLFNVVGIQSQFDNTAPYTSGYQIVPRRTTDIIAINNPTIAYTTASGTIAENGGSYNLPITLSSNMQSTEDVKIFISSIAGNPVYGTDYSTTPNAILDTISLRLSKGANTVSIPVQIIDNTTYNPNRVIRFDLVSNTAGITIGTGNSFTLTITENDPNATHSLEKINVIYPNPTKGSITIQANGIVPVQVYDLQGKMMFNSKVIGGMPTDLSLNQGIYMVRCMIEGKWNTSKLIVE